jgi:hypothetical protein
MLGPSILSNIRCTAGNVACASHICQYIHVWTTVQVVAELDDRAVAAFPATVHPVIHGNNFRQFAGDSSCNIDIPD